MVERTHQRPMVRLFRRMDGVDARCVRLHRLPAHYGADRAGVWRSDHRSDRGLLGHPSHAARRCDSLRLVGRPFGTAGTADDFDPMVFVCNLLAGLSPTFTFLFITRALLGIGMGAEWPAGAALAMESWPALSRGLMSGVLQGSWGLVFALSALAYGFLYA